MAASEEPSTRRKQMTYNYLGKSGLKSSAVILGCMSYGSPDWQSWIIEKDQALPLMKQAYDLGINTWDTANTYSNGLSERLIKEAIDTYKIPRKQLVICTKCYAPVGPKPGPPAMTQPLQNDLWFINHHGLSRTAIMSQCADSLERLGMDHIDLYIIHRSDLRNVSAEETMRALDDLVKSGKVRYIGASSMWAWEFAEYQHAADKFGLTKFISMQNQWSLLYREDERELVPYCNKTGVALTPWYALAAGRLGRPLSQQETTTRSEQFSKRPEMSPALRKWEEDIINRVEEVAKKKSWSMAQVAMVWQRERGAVPLIGISKADRMVEAVECVKWHLDKDEIKYLEEPYESQKVRGHM